MCINNALAVSQKKKSFENEGVANFLLLAGANFLIRRWLCGNARTGRNTATRVFAIMARPSSDRTNRRPINKRTRNLLCAGCAGVPECPRLSQGLSRN